MAWRLQGHTHKAKCVHTWFHTVVSDASSDSWLMKRWPFTPGLVGNSPPCETVVVLHPPTLECSNELWPCGRIIKRSRDTESYRRRDESRMQIVWEGEMDAPESKTPFWSLSNSLSPSISSSSVLIHIVWSLYNAVVCERVYLWLILSLCTLHCIVAEFHPKLQKLVKQFPSWGSLKYETAEL